MGFKAGSQNENLQVSSIVILTMKTGSLVLTGVRTSSMRT
jgi:hypothetical protein